MAAWMWATLLLPAAAGSRMDARQGSYPPDPVKPVHGFSLANVGSCELAQLQATPADAAQRCSQRRTKTASGLP